MKKLLRTILPFITLLLFFTACIVTSINPIYTENDIVFRDDFLGSYIDGDSNSWIITLNKISSSIFQPKLEDSLDPKDIYAYKLEYTDGEGTGVFVLHLADISGAMFVDFYPNVQDIKENIFYSYHRVPVHSFGLIEFTDTTTNIRLLKYEWFEEFIEKNPDNIGFTRTESTLLLTAETKRLQQFMTKCKNNPLALDEPIVLKRLSN